MSAADDITEAVANTSPSNAEDLPGYAPVPRAALGLAVLSTIATTRTENVLATGRSTVPNALTEGFQSAFLGGAVIAALGVVATLVLIRTRDSKAHVEMANAEASQAEAAPVGA